MIDYLRYLFYIMNKFKYTKRLGFLCAAVSSLMAIEAMAYSDLSEIEPKAGPATIEKSPMMMQAGMAQALEAGAVGSIKFIDKPGMEAFYAARGYEPAWIETSFFGANKVDAILSTFNDAWKHGLNPKAYNISKISELSGSKATEDRFQLELIITDALVRYGRDLTGMRINPRDIGQRAKYWRQPLRGIDILDHVSNASGVQSALKSLAPQGELYKKLQRELVKLYKTPEQSSQFKSVSMKGILRPGEGNKAVATIRERMGFSAQDAVEGAYVYDDRLVKAVQAFQKGSGLKPDGIIGPHTIKLMNITRQERINQVLVNLERLRWVEPQKPERYVMVNVPSATLWAVGSGRVVMEMPVVVGRKKRPTNIFTTTITGIRFNPTWTVPPTIKKDDYLPKLQENPYYLSDRGIEISQEGETLDPGMVDWTSMTQDDVWAYKMVQGSGNANPLGRMRVIMNNPFNIYLHDTPTKSYFKRTNRALSSGCIRLERPQEFAEFVLEPNDNWSSERKQTVMDSMKQTEIWAHKPLPVYILYQTVWLGENGQIIYGNDLYGHDRELLAVLNKQGALPNDVEFQVVNASQADSTVKGGSSPFSWFENRGVDLRPVND